MPKDRPFPEVLRRIFRQRVRSLSKTIISLLPPLSSPAKCRCKGRRCLGCSGENATNFLLRQNDPKDYRTLLNQCFIVVSENAPVFSEFSADSNWSQREIVVKCIELVIRTQPKNSNVISCGFDLYNGRSSPVVDLLTSPAWGLLLSRVGDFMMAYLLRHTSIFLPLSRKIHRQVVGFPINELPIKSSNYSAVSRNEHYLSSTHGIEKKRKRDDIANSMMEADQPSCSFSDNLPPCSRCLRRKKSCQSSCGHHEDKLYELSVPVPKSQSVSISTHTLEKISNIKLGKSNESVARPGKRSRPFGWQRERKRRQLDAGDYCDSSPCKFVCSNKSSLLDWNAPSQLSSDSHKASKNTIEGDYINMKPMFHNLVCTSSIFLRGHILYSLEPNFAGSECLARHIFGSSVANGNTSSSPLFCSGACTFGSKCLFHSLIKSLKVLIRRFYNCQHVRLLMDKHCGIPLLEQISKEESELDIIILEDAHGFDISQRNRSLETIDPHRATKCYCPKVQVVSFIWAVCRRIIPADMLGTCSNWRVLRRNISKFIHLRRFEKFSLKQAIHNLKTSRFPFLSNELSSCFRNDLVNSSGQVSDILERFSMSKEETSVMKHNLMERWIYWLFSSFIVPLIRANFYVTETEFGKQDVYFFPKSVWKKVMKRTITSFKDKGYYPLNYSAVRSILAKRSFGFSKLRLCPKENGARILANLKASSKMPRENFYFKGGQSCGVHGRKPIKFDYYKPVNYVLRDTHTVLKGIKLKEPEVLGSSVFDYNDVYKKLRRFLLELKKTEAAMPDLFLVVSDVSNAFDSVDQDKLLDVMKNIILNDEYHLKQSHQIHCSRKNLWVHENVVLINPIISPRFSSPQSGSLHCVLVNQERSRLVKKGQLFYNLYEHVKKNVIRFDKKFYLQGMGIPQGSILSPLLCSLYFGDLERKVLFPFLERASGSGTKDLTRRQDHDISISQSSSEDKIISKPCYMMLRFFDDFLFISTSKLQATHCLTRLYRGFRAYNCHMNEKKFGHNLSVGTCGIVSNRGYVGEDGISFLRWSGLLINCHSLEIQADYTTYLNNHLNSTLTVSWQDKPGQRLKAKLCYYLVPKSHPIFFDLNINTAAVVRLNIFQVFVICAMKFHCYVYQLSYMYKFRRKFCLDIISRSLRYMDALIKKKMSSIQLDSLPPPRLHLEDGEVEWLGLNAFIQVLTRKHARYAQLLSSLKSKLSAHRLAGHISSDMNYAVDRSHSSLLWKIKY